MNSHKGEKVVNCPFATCTVCTKDNCGIWITTDSGGMCSMSLIATSLKGMFTLFKKSKSEIKEYLEKQEIESGLTKVDNQEEETE